MLPVKVHLIIKKSSIILCVNLTIIHPFLPLIAAERQRCIGKLEQRDKMYKKWPCINFTISSTPFIHSLFSYSCSKIKWERHAAVLTNHHTSPPRAVFLCQERRPFLHFDHKRTPFLTVSRFARNVFFYARSTLAFSMRGRKERETVNIPISVFSLEPRGERQQAAPICAGKRVSDHAQQTAFRLILQGGLQN